MPFLIKGKTNWKYILIVVILAVIVGGGILSHVKYLEREIVSIIKFPEIKKSKKVVEDETANWKTYRNGELGIEFKYSDKFIEVFGIPYKMFAKKGKEGEMIGFSFGPPEKYSYTGLMFTVYTPDYEPPLTQSWPFYDWVGKGDVTETCPHPLEYKPSNTLNRVCNIIEIAEESAIFETFLDTWEASCDVHVNVYFNNRSSSPYKGLNFFLSIPDTSQKVCKFFPEGKEGDYEKLESEFYSQFYTQSKNIMENKNLSEKDKKRLELFNQMVSTFRFIERVKEVERITSFDILKLEEKFVGKNEREIAFLQDGDIWVLSKDLRKKYKIIDTEEAIFGFAVSPEGKEIYWRTGKEIWKRNSNGEIKLLTKAREIDTEAIKKRWEGVEWVDPKELEKLEGGIMSFKLSPDGKYIVYEEIEDYIGCCAGPPNIPIPWIWIIKSDGTGRVKIEKPSGVKRYMIHFDKWFPDSKKILFYFQDPGEILGGSPFFEIGVNGKDPQIYRGIFDGEDLNPAMTIDIFSGKPAFSPDGEKVSYINPAGGIWLANIDGSAKKQILEGDFYGYPSEILNWSEDGVFLAVSATNRFFVLNKKGEIVFETEKALSTRTVFSLDNKYVTDGNDFINLSTKERKEFELPEIKAPYGFFTEPQFFSKTDRLYYFVDPIDSTEEEFLPQLWAIDTINWRNYKITDDVLQVVRIP